MNREKYTISGVVRDKERPEVLRKAGQTPVIVYGGDLEGPVKLALPAREFAKLRLEAGTSSIIDVKAGEEQFQILIKDIQTDPISGDVVHADLLQIDRNKKIRAEVPLSFENEAPAVKTYGAILTHSKDTLEIEALPFDLPHSIEVDQTSLAEIDDVITVADIKVPAGVEVLDEPETILAVVQAPREEEPEEEVNEEEALAKIEASAEKPAEGGDAAAATE
jgi:large subunit ribosomal protein L25